MWRYKQWYLHKKTITTKVIQRKAATLPIEYSLNYLCELVSLQLNQLDPRHPWQLQTRNANANNPPIRLEKMAIKCVNLIQYTNHLSGSEPWNKH